MPILRMDSLSFSYDTHRVLLANASVRLLPGWTALVGANGCGKSTLLQLLAKTLSPDKGRCVYEPSNLRCHFCAQELEEPSAEVSAFAAECSAESGRWMSRLELDRAPWERWATLSAGERKRWQVGAALASDADILLLDEPANHLDEKSRNLLIAALREFTGIGVLVSHDRVFLERLCQRTLWLENGTLDDFALPYAQAREDRERRLQEKVGQRERARHQLQVAERKLTQAREVQQAADRSRQVGCKRREDHDARSIGAKNLRGWAEDRLGRQVEVLRNTRDKAKEHLPPPVLVSKLGRDLFVDFQAAPMPVLMRLEERQVRRSDHIHITGDNGVGKTTLMRRLLSQCNIPAERILWMPQVLTQAEIKSMLQTYNELAPADRGRLGHLLAALGVAPEIVARSPGSLSTGEARKLLLAMGLCRQVWLLVLDEPTNHMDLSSVERLEEALAQYPGALLLTSHDANFAKRCTHERWALGSLSYTGGS